MFVLQFEHCLCFPPTVVYQENMNMCKNILASEITVAKFPSQSTRITKRIAMI